MKYQDTKLVRLARLVICVFLSLFFSKLTFATPKHFNPVVGSLDSLVLGTYSNTEDTRDQASVPRTLTYWSPANELVFQFRGFSQNFNVKLTPVESQVANQAVFFGKSNESIDGCKFDYEVYLYFSENSFHMKELIPTNISRDCDFSGYTWFYTTHPFKLTKSSDLATYQYRSSVATDRLERAKWQLFSAAVLGNVTSISQILSSNQFELTTLSDWFGRDPGIIALLYSQGESVLEALFPVWKLDRIDASGNQFVAMLVKLGFPKLTTLMINSLDVTSATLVTQAVSQLASQCSWSVIWRILDRGLVGEAANSVALGVSEAELCNGVPSDLLDRLTSLGLTPQSKGALIALAVATRNQSLLDRFKDSDFAVDSLRPYSRTNALGEAALKANIPMIQWLASKGASMTILQSKDNLPAILLAAKNFERKRNSAQVIEALLSTGSSINSASSNGYTLLDFVALKLSSLTRGYTSRRVNDAETDYTVDTYNWLRSLGASQSGVNVPPAWILRRN